ncbi:TVP38/TMEM64 family protein [Bacillus fonticola]|uniref:TVP38/TMEM64 family protein n=1 Tax=Bacillus fonticola TaxID=2728853 RepID=UPI0014754F6B|nr:TVP38/TMEM64 family protein [Bacillus fonticola]
MDFSSFFQWISSEENLNEWFGQFRALGPFMGLLLPFIEAFLPFLPLVVFVVVNVNAFGPIFGFLYSWIGASVGSIAVFLVIRKWGNTRFLQFIRRQKQVNKLVKWVERHGFGPLFLFLCFPFTPSALVNIVAGLSKISFIQYSLAVSAGKFVMILMVSYIGSDIPSLFQQPIRSALMGGAIILLWFIGKRVEKWLQNKVEREEQKKVLVQQDEL